jgi:predicted amidohydrolase
VLRNFYLDHRLNRFSESTTNLSKIESASLCSLNIGFLEIEIAKGQSVDARIAHVLQKLREMPYGVFDVIVLPELWTEGAFDLEACKKTDVKIQVKTLKQIADLARSKGVYIHAGTFPIKSTSGRLCNTAVIFSPILDQEIRYEKIHLFGFDEGEKTVFESGSRVVCLDISGIRIGISTCYDLRFSELYLQQIRSGAKVLLLSASWPRMRIEQWKALLIARAIEGQAYVVACNATGISGKVELGGCSMAIDPYGNVMQLEKQSGFLKCTLDLDILDQYREVFPMLQDRRM